MDGLRKRKPRATMGGAVQMNVGTQCVEGQLCTLSTGGALIAGLPSLAPGTRAILFLRIPCSDRPVVTGARVLYETEGAVGVAFEGLEAEDQQRLQRTVESAGAIYVSLRSLLTFAPERRSDIDELCKLVELPPGLPYALLRPRVEIALQRLQLAR